MKRIRRLVLLMATTLLVACEKDIQNTYSNYPAYFVCNTVSTIPQLNAAMNSLGVFCTIRSDRERFLFSDETNKTTPVNATAISSNASIYMGIAGFIVGLPSIPELGTDTSTPVCYDLACPNCYSDYNIARSLKLKEGGNAHCTSCNREYNLNSQGQVAKGNGGINLFRYRISYSGNSMVINNR